MFEIEFYEDKNGKKEVYEYILGLKNSNKHEDTMKLKKIDMYLDLLSLYGLKLREPYIKKVDNEIWELRPLRDRILFAGYCNNSFVMLSVFMKKTNKTPRSEIIKAKKYLKDYKLRRGQDE